MEAIFAEAVSLQGAERTAFLEERCTGHPELRRRIDQLLSEYQQADDFLELPPAELAWGAESVDTARAEDTDAEVVGGLLSELSEMPSLGFLKPSDHPESLGRLGQYEATSVIGVGGMGIVLRALDTRLHRIIALKVVSATHTAGEADRRRFIREARAAAAVSHPNVVTIHDVAEGEPSYLAMELVEGGSLQEIIHACGSLDFHDILSFTMQIAEGLAAAHAQDLIHRDIKPANILIERVTQRAKLSDFGLARASGEQEITNVGEIAGTPQYMSPEQAEGLPVDHRTDLFSFGSVIYAMCTGHSPFRAESTMAVLSRVRQDSPQPLREVNPDVPEWFEAIVTRLLSKDVDRRFTTAEELLGEIERASSRGFAEEKRAIGADRKGLRPRGVTWAVALGLLAILGITVGLVEATGMTNLRAGVASIIRLCTAHGTVVITVEDPEFEVLIDGEELTFSGLGPQEVRLRTGQHLLEAKRLGDVVQQELLTISRGERKLVAVHIEPPRGLRLSERSWARFEAGWEWGEPINFGGPTNSESNEGSPRISADGLTLHFHSDRHEEQDDLFVSVRDSRYHTWQEPRRLGIGVNSDQDDRNPWLARRETLLVFDSNRLGGTDLWLATRSDQESEWEAAIDLAPVNTRFLEAQPCLSQDGLEPLWSY